MQLNRLNVTNYSSYMIPVFPAFAAGVGISWVVTPIGTLQNTPVFDVILHIIPAWAWGFIYLISGSVMFIAVFHGNRKWYIMGLRVLGVSASLLALANFAAFFSSGAIFSSWLWPAFIAYATRVTGKSLLMNESDSI